MPANNKHKIAQTKTLVDLLVSGRDLPSDFLESLQAWLIDNDGEEVKNEVLRDYFDDLVSSPDSMEHTLRLWPDLAKRLGMDQEMIQNVSSETGIRADAAIPLNENVDHSTPRKKSLRRRIMGYSAAAVILLAVGITFFLTNQPVTSDPPDQVIAMYTISTAAGDTISVILPDGSKASLRENTTLSYFEDFITNRKVAIDGEVFLDVIHDEQFPFTVNNKDIQVVVVGTEFNVKDSEQSSDAEVALITGRVTVIFGDNSLTLNPGEKVNINKISRSIETTGLTRGEMTKIMGAGLEFDDISLDEAFSRIGKYFRVDMRVSSDVPQVDGVIMKLDYDVTLNDALFLLQAINPVFDYRVQDSEVIISRQVN